MSKNYKQLSLVQRYQIEALIKAGIKQNKIAEQLGVNASTISRELNRNKAKRGRTAGIYVATNAQRKTDLRHKNKPKLTKFTDSMKKQISFWLTKNKWSPEIISIVGKKTDKCPISHEWIYQWIWQCKQGIKADDRQFKKLYTTLKHGKRRRKRGSRNDSRGIIPHRVSIENRPSIVNRRRIMFKYASANFYTGISGTVVVVGVKRLFVAMFGLAWLFGCVAKRNRQCAKSVGSIATKSMTVKNGGNTVYSDDGHPLFRSMVSPLFGSEEVKS